VSHKTVEVPTSVPSANVSSSTTTIPTATVTTDETGQKDSVTDLPITNTKPTVDDDKTQIREEFRKSVAARLFHSDAPTDKV